MSTVRSPMSSGRVIRQMFVPLESGQQVMIVRAARYQSGAGSAIMAMPISRKPILA